MMSRALPSCLAWLVLGAVPSVAAAAPPEVSLDVDTSALPEDEVTDALEARMIEHQQRTLRDGGIEVVDDAEMQIRVVVTRYGEGDVHSAATVTLFEVDSDQPAFERRLTCELCRDSELIATVGEEIARLSGRLLYAPRPKAEAESVQSEPSAEGENLQPQTDEAPQKLGTLGYAGIGSLAAGAGTLGAGVALALRPDEARLAGTHIERRSTRTLGLALVGVGSALLVTGAVLVTLDVVRRNKPRKVSLIPTLTPSVVTLGMHMRF